LKEFVSKRQSLQNIDFIVLAMNQGLIGDGLSVDCETNYESKVYGVQKENDSNTNRIEFIDKDYKLHDFYVAGRSITELTGYQGFC